MSSAASRKEKSKKYKRAPKLMWDFRDFFVVFKRTIFVFCFSHCLFSFHRFGSPFLSDSSAFLGFRWNLFFRNLCVFLACFLASQRFCFCFYFLDAFSSPRAEHALIAFLTIYRSIQVLIILWLGFASACCFSCHRCGVPCVTNALWQSEEGGGWEGRAQRLPLKRATTTALPFLSLLFDVDKKNNGFAVRLLLLLLFVIWFFLSLLLLFFVILSFFLLTMLSLFFVARLLAVLFALLFLLVLFVLLVRTKGNKQQSTQPEKATKDTKQLKQLKQLKNAKEIYHPKSSSVNQDKGCSSLTLFHS